MERVRARVLSLPTEADVREEALRMQVPESGLGMLLEAVGIGPVKLEGVPARIATALRQAVVEHHGIAIAAPSPSPASQLEGAGPSPEEQAPASTQGSFLRPEPSSELVDFLVYAPVSLLLEVASRMESSGDGDERGVGTRLRTVVNRYRGRELGTTRCGDFTFEWGKRTYVMGIINVTPDSFSGEGVGTDVDAAVAQGTRFVEEGADILDVGGESTRPGAVPVSVEEEIRRVVPVVRRLVDEVRVPVSVDSYKLLVVQEALEAGARMINDVWGLRRTEGLASLAAAYDVPIVLMHNRTADASVGQLGGHYRKVQYTDLMGEISRELEESLELALGANVKRENVILDPGIGFGKSPDQNLVVMRRLKEMKSLGRPVLMGTSRKSFIGLALGAPVEDRVEGTAATVAMSICNGADIVRVHDVKVMARVARMTDAITRVISDE